MHSEFTPLLSYATGGLSRRVANYVSFSFSLLYLPHESGPTAAVSTAEEIWLVPGTVQERTTPRGSSEIASVVLLLEGMEETTSYFSVRF